jgi:hypothetical protein
MEYFLKRRVFEGGTVYIARYPVVVEDWGALAVESDQQRPGTPGEKGLRWIYQFFVVHVICRARNPGVIQTALINKFEEIVYAGEDVVHEDYGIEILVLGVSLLVKGHKGSIANFSKIFDTVVERPTCALRCADGDTKADGAGECVENAEEGFCLVCGTVLVDGDKDVVVTKEG